MSVYENPSMVQILSCLRELGLKNLDSDNFLGLFIAKIIFFQFFEAWGSNMRGFLWDIFGIQAQTSTITNVHGLLPIWSTPILQKTWSKIDFFRFLKAQIVFFQF